MLTKFRFHSYPYISLTLELFFQLGDGGQVLLLRGCALAESAKQLSITPHNTATTGSVLLTIHCTTGPALLTVLCTAPLAQHYSHNTAPLASITHSTVCVLHHWPSIIVTILHHWPSITHSTVYCTTGPALNIKIIPHYSPGLHTIYHSLVQHSEV